MESSKLYTAITKGALRHASDEPEQETGDLQDALSLALALMTPEQLLELSNIPEILGIALGIGPNDPSMYDYETFSLPSKLLAQIEENAETLTDEENQIPCPQLHALVFPTA